MLPTTHQLVTTVRATFLERIVPLLPQHGSEQLVAAFDVALCEILRRLDGRSKTLKSSCAELDWLIARAEQLLSADAPERIETELSGSLEVLELDLSLRRERIVELIPGVRELARETVNPDAQEALRWLEAVVCQQYSEVESEASFVPLPDAAVPVTRDLQLLEKSIADNRDVRGAPSVMSIDTLSGGYSRETLSVTYLRAANTEPENLILRKQVPDGLIEGFGLDVAEEFQLLRFASDQGLPVAEPYWIEMNEQVVGGRFIAMPRIRGEQLGTHGHASADSGAMRAMAQLVARVHRLPWSSDYRAMSAFGLRDGDDLSISACLDRYLQKIEALYARSILRPSPMLTMGMAWLRENAPRDPRTAMLQHGDWGFHNLIFDRGRIAALLDWEAAFPLHPAKDLAQCRMFVGSDERWNKFYEAYLHFGGYEVSHGDLEYFTALQSTFQVLIGDIAIETRFAHRINPPIEMLVLGGPIRAYCYSGYMQHAHAIWRQP